MEPLALLIGLFSFLGTFEMVSCSGYGFPSLPQCFKTRIAGKIIDELSPAFSIDQYYCNSSKKIIGKTIFSSDMKIYGYIHDEVRNHSLRFDNIQCDMHPLQSVDYEPFNFSSSESSFVPLIDPIVAFQDSSWITSSEMFLEDGIQKTMFLHAANLSSSYPYAISVAVDNDLGQFDHITISEVAPDGNETLLITMRYDHLTAITDPDSIATPPHDVLCKADHHVDIPELGPFYFMEIRILSEYYKKQESLALVKIAEYINEGEVSITYHANTDQHVHETSIVHNYKSGEGFLINRDMELCHDHVIDTGDTLDQKKEEFKTAILSEMHFYDKKYFVHFWQVLEMVKNSSVDWQYQGKRVIDSTTCNVWAYPLLNTWIAEVAYSEAQIRLRENSFSNKLMQVPVSVDLFRMDSPDDEGRPAISFRISDYQIDSNPVSTEQMFDTSVCYADENACVVQFKLDIPYRTLVDIGLGNVKRAISQAVVASTHVEGHQIHHISVSPVLNSQSLTTMTVYQGTGVNVLAVKLFKDRIQMAVDSPIHATFTNENTDKIQIAYTVRGSLIFDYQIVNDSHWSVSIAATVSLCIGTLFVGMILGIIFVNCWKRRSVNVNCGQLNYRRFKDEEIEEVEIDGHATL